MRYFAVFHTLSDEHPVKSIRIEWIGLLEVVCDADALYESAYSAASLVIDKVWLQATNVDDVGTMIGTVSGRMSCWSKSITPGKAKCQTCQDEGYVLGQGPDGEPDGGNCPDCNSMDGSRHHELHGKNAGDDHGPTTDSDPS